MAHPAYSNNLKKIKRLYKEYINSRYVYKKCSDYSESEIDKSKKWLIIMEKLDDTISNEERNDVFDKKYAMFRCNKIKVIEIFNANDPELKKDKIINMYENSENKQLTYTTYEINKIVHPDSYNEDINQVYSNGIHYFKTIDCAYFYEVTPIMHSGPVTKWHENGRVYLTGKYLNGLETGKWIGFYDNGDVRCIGEYKNGLENGKWTLFYPYDGSLLRSFFRGNWTQRRGRKMEEGNFCEGKKTDKWTEWNNDGTKRCEGYFLQGMEIGKWYNWYYDGIIKAEEVA
jgi:antitoxin component YwqK of YwqJK toxin-antitoxin module